MQRFLWVWLLLFVASAAVLASTLTLCRRLGVEIAELSQSRKTVLLQPTPSAPAHAEKEAKAGSGRVGDLPPLQAKLIGTLMAERPELAQAFVLETDRNRQRTLLIGDNLQGRGVIEIARAFIRLRQPNGKEEVLRIEDTRRSDAPIQAVGSHEYRIDRRKLLETVHGDAAQLLSDVRLTPQIENFQMVGVHLTHIKPNSIAAQAGFKTHDTIRTINGAPVDSLRRALAIYHELRRSPEVAVEVIRDGQACLMRYLVH